MATTIYKTLGRRIAQRRKELGLTQERLAERIGVGTSYVARIEAGTRKAPLETFIAIGDALGSSLAGLLGQEKRERAASRTPTDLEDSLASLGNAELRLLAEIARRFARRPR